MGGCKVIRLVNQFDPPTRHASVATATCSSCSCCCCCCCVVSGMTVATFAAVNLSRSSRSHQSGLGAWSIARPIVVYALAVIGLLVVGAGITLSTLSTSGGNLVFYALLAFVILGGGLAAFYRSTGEPQSMLAGFITTLIGSVLATAEGFGILYGVLGISNRISPAVQLLGYGLLAIAGIGVGVWAGRRVRWPQFR